MGLYTHTFHGLLQAVIGLQLVLTSAADLLSPIPGLVTASGQSTGVFGRGFVGIGVGTLVLTPV